MFLLRIHAYTVIGKVVEFTVHMYGHEVTVEDIQEAM